MNIPKFRVTMELCLALAKVALTRDGMVAPIVLLKKKGSDQLVATRSVNELLRNDSTKGTLNELIRREARRLNAEASYFITEMWHAKQYDGSYTSPPSEVPERRECLAVIGEVQIDGKIERISIFQFFHKEGKEVVFGERKEHNEKNESHRFQFLS